MNEREAIGVLQSIRSKENQSHEKNKKLYTNPQPNLGVVAIDVAIAALERQEKESCESCGYWKCRDAKYCPICGRRLEG